MKHLPTILLGTAASALMLASEMPAAAQQQAPQQGQPMSPEESSMEVDDEEIQRFANAFEAVQSIQKESREQMARAIEQQGLTIKEYNELFRQQQQQNAGGESEMSDSNFSEEKQQQFEQADARIDQIEQEAQSEIEQAITQKGLEVERFEQIWIAVRQDPELQQRVQNVLQN